MKIKLKRQNKAVHFSAVGADGHVVNIDGSEKADGEGKGVRPMELILMAAASCSSIDIHLIMKKMRQPFDDLQIEVEGERVDAVPAVFKKITMTYHFKGDLKPDKVQKAIEMSLKKYCSVTQMLEGRVKIDYAYTINGERGSQFQ